MIALSAGKQVYVAPLRVGSSGAAHAAGTYGRTSLVEPYVDDDVFVPCGTVGVVVAVDGGGPSSFSSPFRGRRERCALALFSPRGGGALFCWVALRRLGEVLP